MNKFKDYKKALIYLIRKANIYPLNTFNKNVPKHINYLKPKVDENLKNLRNFGISCINLSEIISKDLLKETSEYIFKLREYNSKTYKKAYLKNYLGGNYDDCSIQIYDWNNPIIQIAFNPFILNLVKSYLKQDCRLIDINLAETVKSEELSRVNSQRWHRDPAVRGLIKVFIYFSDVAEDNGPFEYIKKTHNKLKIKPSLGPVTTKRFGGSFYPNQDKINTLIKSNLLEPKTFTGKSYEMIIADTTGLHRGGYCKKKSRIMLTLVYYPKGDPWGSKIKVINKRNKVSKFQYSFF